MVPDLSMLCEPDGIFLRRDALAVGWDDSTLASLVRRRVVRRIRHGAYAPYDHWETLDERAQHLLRARAVLRSAQTALALSHTTALAAMQAPAWELPREPVHVTRLDGRAGRREAGVAQHRGLILPGDVIDIAGVPLTSPIRTALDVSTMTDVEHALPVMDHVLRLPGITKSQMHERARLMAGTPGSLATDLVIRLADGRAESVGESRSRYMIWRGGLPTPIPQFEIRDERGSLIARVDFAWPEFGVFLEFDGRVKYQKLRAEGQSVVDVVLAEKRREELICRLTGWRCIRIVWSDLYRARQTIEWIQGVLVGGPIH